MFCAYYYKCAQDRDPAPWRAKAAKQSFAGLIEIKAPRAIMRKNSVLHVLSRLHTPFFPASLAIRSGYDDG